MTRVLALALLALLACTGARAQTKWDMPTPYGDSFFHTQNNRQFAEDIKKASGGQIELVVHSNQSLLKHVDILRGVQTGQVSAQVLPSALCINAQDVMRAGRLEALQDYVNRALGNRTIERLPRTLAIVGSRDALPETLEYARHLAARAVEIHGAVAQHQQLVGHAQDGAVLHLVDLRLELVDLRGVVVDHRVHDPVQERHGPLAQDVRVLGAQVVHPGDAPRLAVVDGHQVFPLLGDGGINERRSLSERPDKASVQ